MDDDAHAQPTILRRPHPALCTATPGTAEARRRETSAQP